MFDIHFALVFLFFFSDEVHHPSTCSALLVVGMFTVNTLLTPLILRNGIEYNLRPTLYFAASALQLDCILSF